MTVNGRLIELTGEMTVSGFLEREGFSADRVAVEKNGEIVPRRLFDTETLCDGDKIEVVHFVGGG